MRNALRHWLVPALVATLVVTTLGLVLRAGAVEADIGARITARLAEAGLDWAEARIAGRDVTLHGTAPAVEEQREARSAVEGIWGVARVRDDTGLIPLIEPFAWAAAKSPTALAFSGYVPSQAVREAIRQLAGAAHPDLVVDDQSALARGAPETFQSEAEFAVRMLADFTHGSVVISDTAATIEGTAIDRLRYEAARDYAASGLPDGLTLAKSAILPPLAKPFAWKVAFDGNLVLIEGSVPDEAMGQVLAGAAGQILGEVPTDDRTELASGAPEGFAAMARHAIALLARMDHGRVTLTDTTLAIDGRARSLDDYDALLLEVAAAAPEGLTVTGTIAPALVAPYVWQATRAPAGIELDGFMPDRDAQTAVLAAARSLFGDNVADRSRIAEGAPRMDWIGAAKFGLGQLEHLSGGTANITDHAYSVAGAAATSEGFEIIGKELAGTLPASLELADVAVVPPFASPYRFGAEVSDTAVTFSGNAPSVVARDALGTMAADRFAGREVKPELALASGAPDGFEEAAAAGLGAMARLAGARMELVDRTLTLGGVAPYAVAADRVRQQLADGLPAGFMVSAALTVSPPETRVTPAQCQDLLLAALAGGTVQFGRGDAAIAGSSEPLLDRLVVIVQRCPDAQVEVGGHTDSGGTTRRNRELSQRRATSVADYLVDAGVLRERLTAVGFGETKPVGDNGTEEGRAKNRRIEFTVKEP